MHLTDFDRQTAPTPSNFVTKLRKHLKTRRLSQIKQIGNDRVLVLEFSDGMFYLVLEFFSAGNILLLDHDRKILSLQRMVNDKGDNDRYAVNEPYNMFDETLFHEEFEYHPPEYSVENVEAWIQTHKENLQKKSQVLDRKKKSKVFSIHKLLFVNVSHLSSDLIQKNLHDVGISTSSSALEYEGRKDDLQNIVSALEKAEADYQLLIAPLDKEISGYIVSKKNQLYDPSDEDSLEYVYDEFHPFKPYKENPSDYKFTEIQGYNKVLDTFFSTLESTKYALRIEQKKQQAARRLDHARSERDRQIESLISQQELNHKKGEVIMYHADLVDSCRESVQKLIDQQMDWTNIESVIKLEQTRGNKIAQAIKLPLNLKENKITLVLPDTEAGSDSESDSDKDSNSDSDSDSDSESESESESEDESDSDSDSDSESESDSDSTRKTKKPSKTSPVVSVVIDLSLSPYANARTYFGTKKVAETKQAKVEKSTHLALQNAQRRIDRDLAKDLKAEHETLKLIRPKYWFEKFFWFVSSEGYLCLAGRDDLQTDMIYYRHFSDNDAFVSSDIEGSLKVFIKNPYKAEVVPPSTLMQAGIFAMSASNAWNSKITTSAWVLHGDEVSKMNLDGSLVRSGHFNYNAKKEYLPPAQLVMGFAFYWLIGEESSLKYKEARVARQNEHGLTIVMDNHKKDLEKLSEATERTKDSANGEEAKEEGADTKENNEEETKAEAYAELSDPKSVTASVKQEGKKLSAKERRNLNKSKSPESEDDVFDPIKESLKNLKLEEEEKPKTPAQKPPNVRGKKAKLKKIAAKYGTQDEEERRLRMDALGTLKQVEELEKQKKEQVLKENEKHNKHQNDSRKKKQEEREYKKYLTEDVNEDESSITDYLEILDSLVVKPQTEDTLISVVPVFAPWASLNKFKYKVKVQPGLGKKGKALNEALNYYNHRKMDPESQDTDLDWPSEREVISGIKPNDLMGVFTVNKLKLVLPGGNSTPDKGKKSSKGSGKKKR